MARTTWTVEVLGSGGGYTATTSIVAPNESTELGTTSNVVKQQLADGSLARILPETYFVPDEVQFTWLAEDATFAGVIKSFVENADQLRITDHNGGTYLGRFTSVKRIWLTSLDPDMFDVQATFDMSSGTA